MHHRREDFDVGEVAQVGGEREDEIVLLVDPAVKTAGAGGEGFDGRAGLHELIDPDADAVVIVVGGGVGDRLAVVRLAGEHFVHRRRRENARAGDAIDAVVGEHIHEAAVIGGGRFDAAGDTGVRVAGENELRVRHAEGRREALGEEVDVVFASGDFRDGAGDLHREAAVGEGAAGRIGERRLFDDRGRLAKRDVLLIEDERRSSPAMPEVWEKAWRMVMSRKPGTLYSGRKSARWLSSEKPPSAESATDIIRAPLRVFVLLSTLAGRLSDQAREDFVVDRDAMLEEANFEAGDGRADVLAGKGAVSEGGETGEVVGGWGGSGRGERRSDGQPADEAE